MLSAVLGASLAMAGCSALFPARDDAGSTATSGTGGGTGTTTKPKVGDPNNVGASGSITGACLAGSQRCYGSLSCVVPAGAQVKAEICTKTCGADGDCPTGTRCADTGQETGKLCLRTCNATSLCTASVNGLRCIPTVKSDKLCWIPGSKSGEVTSEPQPIIERIQLAATGSGSPWLVPGAKAKATLVLRNNGVVDLKQTSITLISKSDYVSVTSESAQIDTLPGDGQPGLTVLQPQFEVKPAAPYDVPFDMTLRVVDGSTQREWFLPFAMRAFRSAGVMHIASVQLTDGGAPVTVVAPGKTYQATFYGLNLGFGAVNQLQVKVTPTDPMTGWAPGALVAPPFEDPSKYPTPLDPVPVVQGSLTIAPTQLVGPPVLLTVQMTTPYGGSWTQELTIPTAP